MPLKVLVDKSTCIGCGVAPATCPQVFELGPDGKNRVKDEYSISETDEQSIGQVPDDLADCVRAAESSCPVSAIKVEEV